MEYDTYYDEVNKFRPERSNYPVNLKSPDELGFDAQVSYINSFINELERRLYTPEEMNARTYLEMLDPDSFVDWWFVYEIVGNGYEPSGPRSCYFHKDRGGKLKAGPVWDFDSYTFRSGISGFQVDNKLYYGKLFSDPFFVALVKKKWPILKERLSGMEDYIESQQRLILNSSLRDAQMWPIPTTFVRNYDEQLSVPEANLRLINNYSSRINELDNLIHSLVVNYDTLPGGNEDVDAQQDKSDDFNFNFQ